jgi:hypothetical protein
MGVGKRPAVASSGVVPVPIPEIDVFGIERALTRRGSLLLGIEGDSSIFAGSSSAGSSSFGLSSFGGIESKGGWSPGCFSDGKSTGICSINVTWAKVTWAKPVPEPTKSNANDA